MNAKFGKKSEASSENRIDYAGMLSPKRQMCNRKSLGTIQLAATDSPNPKTFNDVTKSDAEETKQVTRINHKEMQTNKDVDSILTTDHGRQSVAVQTEDYVSDALQTLLVTSKEKPSVDNDTGNLKAVNEQQDMKISELDKEAEALRCSLDEVLVENELLHATLVLLRKRLTELSQQAQRAQCLSDILKVLIEDADESDGQSSEESRQAR